MTLHLRFAGQAGGKLSPYLVIDGATDLLPLSAHLWIPSRSTASGITYTMLRMIFSNLYSEPTDV